MIVEYEKVNTPEELMLFMNKYIKYGFHGIDGVNYTNDGSNEQNEIFQKAVGSVYGLASPDYLLTYGIGHCWDQVELERDWFTKHNYEFKTNFIWFLFDYDNNYSTHTYLIYKDKITNEYCLFEHADYDNRGIHRFKSYKEAVIFQMNKHIEYNKKQGNLINEEVLSHLHIYEYIKPKYGINMIEFLDNILESKDITNIIRGD